MKTVSINEPTHKELKALCKTHKKSIVEFMQFGVLYFKQTGIDPEHAFSESPQKAIKELSKRVEQIIGLIKTQEQEKINPLLETIMMLVRRLEMMLNDAPKETSFKAVITRMETMMEEDEKYHSQQMKAQDKFYKESLEEILKGHDQVNAEGIKKLDEVLGKVENMAVTLRELKSK